MCKADETRGHHITREGHCWTSQQWHPTQDSSDTRNDRDEIAVWEMDSERDLPLGPLLATLARQLTGETG